MITAIVLVQAEVDRIPEVAAVIADLDGVTEVYSVTGGIDLVAMVRVREHDDLASVIADKLNKVDGAWTCPVGGSAAVRAELEPLEAARREVVGFAGVR